MKNIPGYKKLPSLNLPHLKINLNTPVIPRLGRDLTTGLMSGLNTHNLIIQKTGRADHEKKPITAGRGGTYYSKKSMMGHIALYGVK